MSRSEGVIWCDGCGVEITWVPIVKRGDKAGNKKEYCCEECLLGFKCRCGERMELEDEYRLATGTPEVYY